MAGPYLFNCPSCSEANELSPKQAGQELPCSSCSAIFQAPKLGDIRKLPVHQDATQQEDSSTSYSPLQGWLFASGLTIAVLAGVGAWQLQAHAKTLASELDVQTEIKDFNTLVDSRSPAQIYVMSTAANEDFGVEYVELDYKRKNAQSKILTNVSYGIWGICGLGILLLIGSFLVKP